MHLSKPREYTTGMNSGVWVTMMCQYKFIDCNKCSICVLSDQFCSKNQSLQKSDYVADSCLRSTKGFAEEKIQELQQQMHSFHLCIYCA